MFKAIIESIENNGYSAKIRIPFFNGYSSSIGSTNEYELYTASICSAPGCDPAYQVGDIVYIDFEDRDEGKPVIVGIFYRQDYLSSANINTQSLNVAVSAEFPEDTAIGNVNKNNIKSLTRISDNVQYQISELTGNIEDITGEIPTKVSQLENDSGYITEDDIPPIPSKVSELENDENFIDEDTLEENIEDIPNLYIWAIYQDEGSELGEIISNFVINNSSLNPTTVYYSTSIITYADGTIGLNNPNNISLGNTNASATEANSTLKGMYIKLNSDSLSESTYFVPSNANFSRNTSASPTQLRVDKIQEVTELNSIYKYIANISSTKYPDSGFIGNYYYKKLDSIGNAINLLLNYINQ